MPCLAGGRDDEPARHQTAHRHESGERQTESNRANGERPWMRRHLACLDDYGLRHDLGDTELRAAFGPDPDGRRCRFQPHRPGVAGRQCRLGRRREHVGRRFESHHPDHHRPARHKDRGQPRDRTHEPGDAGYRERGHGRERDLDGRHAPRPPLPGEEARSKSSGSHDKRRRHAGRTRIHEMDEHRDRCHRQPQLTGFVSLLHGGMLRDISLSSGPRPASACPQPTPEAPRASGCSGHGPASARPGGPSQSPSGGCRVLRFGGRRSRS